MTIPGLTRSAHPKLASGACLGLLILLGSGACGGGDTTEPLQPPDNSPPGHIVFRAWDECSEAGQIYRMGADGSEVTPIALGEDPKPSPDGSLIAFTRRSHLFLIRSDGSNERELGIDIMGDFSWSPAGSRLATVLTGGALVSVEVQTGRIDTLYLDPRTRGLDDDWGSRPWSSDGGRIYFLLNDAQGLAHEGVYELALAERTMRPVIDVGWSPFVNDALGRLFFRHETDNLLWSATLLGGDLRLCADVGQECALSHDRRWLVYERDVDGGGGDLFREDLWRLDLGLCTSDSLSTLGTGGLQPWAWSPDDGFVVIARDGFAVGHGYDELFIVEVATGIITNVSTNLPRCALTSVSWSQ
jgi:hypothetical protein